MKKLLVILLVLGTIGGIGGSVYFNMQFKKVRSEKDMLVQQNAQLQAEVDKVGPLTEVWTPANTVDWKTPISKSDFVAMTVPVSEVTEDTVTDISTIEGKLYKTTIHSGTPMTYSLVMDEEFEETIYEEDLTFNHLPLGLEVGDYIDVVEVLPYGEKFCVFPHVRVVNMVPTVNVVKVRLTEAKKMLWLSCQKDKALWGAKGLSIRAEKYVEPGINDTVIPNYPVRAEMESAVNMNPNITNKKECINSALRKQIDLMLAVVEEEDGGSLASGESGLSSSINSAFSAYVEKNNSTAAMTNSSSEEELIGLTEEDIPSDLQGSDAYGNTASVTSTQRDDSRGSSIFGEESVLE